MPKNVYAASKLPKSESGSTPLSKPMILAACEIVILIVGAGILWMTAPRTVTTTPNGVSNAQQQPDNVWIADKLKSTGGVWNKLTPDEQRRADIISQGHGQQVFRN